MSSILFAMFRLLVLMSGCQSFLFVKNLDHALLYNSVFNSHLRSLLLKLLILFVETKKRKCVSLDDGIFIFKGIILQKKKEKKQCEDLRFIGKLNDWFRNASASYHS